MYREVTQSLQYFNDYVYISGGIALYAMRNIFDCCKLKMKMQGPTAPLGEQRIVHVPLLEAIYSIGLRLGGGYWAKTGWH